MIQVTYLYKMMSISISNMYNGNHAHIYNRNQYMLNWYSLSTFVQTVSESSVQDSDEERPESYKREN